MSNNATIQIGAFPCSRDDDMLIYDQLPAALRKQVAYAIVPWSCEAVLMHSIQYGVPKTLSLMVIEDRNDHLELVKKGLIPEQTTFRVERRRRC